MLATSESPNMYTKKVEQAWKQTNYNQGELQDNFHALPKHFSTELFCSITPDR
jgi:hypothetical protein